MLNPVLATRLVFFLGITNLVGLALVFFSCRCLMGPKLAQTMLKSILAIWIYGIPVGK